MVNRSIVSVLGFLLLSLLVSACAPTVKPIEISAKPVAKPDLILPKADAINTRDVKWIIVTADNYQQVFDDLSKSGHSGALFALTDQGYQDLAMNTSDIRAFIQQQQAIILAYEGYYRRSNAAIDAANQQINTTVGQLNSH